MHDITLTQGIKDRCLLSMAYYWAFFLFQKCYCLNRTTKDQLTMAKVVVINTRANYIVYVKNIMILL